MYEPSLKYGYNILMIVFNNLNRQLNDKGHGKGGCSAIVSKQYRDAWSLGFHYPCRVELMECFGLVLLGPTTVCSVNTSIKTGSITPDCGKCTTLLQGTLLTFMRPALPIRFGLPRRSSGRKPYFINSSLVLAVT